ncbi:helicase, partial [Acinetobacter baumannii]
RKKANNLLFYSDIFPASFKGQLKSLIENKPSNELLEAISMALVKDGVFLRREHDFSKLEFRTYHASTQYQTASRELSDQLAQVLSKMAYLSGDVEEKVAKMNSEIKHNVEHMKEGSWQENRMQVNSMNFASRMHNISRQILLSVTTPLIIDQALESLKENRKPVIGLENTGESLLKMLLLKDSKAFELLDQINELKDSSDYDRALSDLNSGKMNQNEFDQEPIIVKLKKLEQDLAQFKQEDTILAKPPTIADLLENMVHKLDIIQVRDRYGQVRSETIDDEIYSDFKQDILDNIRKLPDIPLCPLDLIKAELESRGYKVGEISGREYQLKKIDSNQGSVFKVEVRQENNPTAKTKACNEFQSGILDAMIITRAGSTGLSLHAIPVNDGSPSQSDHLRQREFLTGQSPQAIDEFLQMIGRVDRKGQVSAPIISQFDTGLPIQRKFLMMHNAKLAELSANVTSNRENVNKQVTDVD